jgi:hypothetical protein
VTDPKREFIKIIRSGFQRHHAWKVFGDFCEMAACSLYNRLQQDPLIEERYLRARGRYEADEAKHFPELFDLVVQGLEASPRDFLGECFQELELSNHWVGQFFSPYPIAQLMAELNVNGLDPEQHLKEHELITVSDPACGAGVMVIAFAQALRERGINYQTCLYAEGTDVDPTAAHMSYIQWSLLGIPATVYLGNTLSMEMREAWRTPFYWMGTNCWKIRRWRQGQSRGAEAVAVDAPIPALAHDVKLGEQMDLLTAIQESAA